MRFIIILFLITSCTYKYKINDDYIRSNWKIKHYIYIGKISNIKKYDQGGRPLIYQLDTILVCKKKDSKYHNRRTIYFHKSNQGYEWFLIKPFTKNNIYDMLPIQFAKNEWYVIYNLYYKFNHDRYEIYLYKYNNSMKIIEYDYQGPF